MRQDQILALLGGDATVNSDFSPYNPYGEEELAAATEVIKSGCLSSFIGAWTKDFYGGVQVKAFEQDIADFFGVKHAISVISWTSGLMCAVGALNINPGDEIIVSPWTMSASATAILMWNAIPVFADIDKNTFNLDPDEVIKNISPRTKAIMVPSIFGYSADFSRLCAIAKEYNLKIIEDAAQAPAVKYRGKYVGTFGDIGGYSFNYHKHVHTGEGGVCVTDDDELAEKMRLIRNHAEAVVDGKIKSGIENVSLVNMVGFNFRMGEIEAAMGREQLKKLPQKVDSRFQLGLQLKGYLDRLPGLMTTHIEDDATHAFYVLGIVLEGKALAVGRDRIIEALEAEGIPALAKGYINLHRYEMYTQKIAYGDQHFPWKIGDWESPVTYGDGVCPVAEALQDYSYFSFLLCQHNFTTEQIDQIGRAFGKVWSQLDSLTVHNV